MIKSSLFIFMLIVLLAISCEEKPVPIYDAAVYEMDYGSMPTPTLPADNLLTAEGVELGRMLFYDKALSRDLSQSCADCHVQSDGFSDKNQFSTGIENLQGNRQAMSIFNMGFHKRGFFWDGRAETLRDQALLPIQDPLEMDNSLEKMINTLQEEESYRDQFIRAFEDGQINVVNVSLALEQFMLSIVSNDSKYDRFTRGEGALTPSELRGLDLFNTEYNPFFPEVVAADCMHCHGGANFENDLYMNNGLDSEENIADIGYMAVTANLADKGKFKVPSLRNIAVTAPYMHDGRFNSLEEVLDHYTSGIQMSNSLNEALIPQISTGLNLTEQDKADIIAFLHTLTDETFLTNPAYQSPF